MKLFLSLILAIALAAIQISGFTPNTKIVNGETSKPGQFPYQAMLIAPISDVKRRLCGGSLISAQWVVTAAHCVCGVRSIDVHLGAQSLDNLTETGRIIVRASQWILHENYTLFVNDIALVQLSTKVQFNDRIQPVSLPAASATSFEGQTVITSGWGVKATSDSRLASELQFADLQVISNKKCTETFPPIIVQPTILCAKGAKLESVCSGDSGGPLVLKENRTLVGVTSFVRGCYNGHPDGFSRVSSYVNWITSKIGSQ